MTLKNHNEMIDEVSTKYRFLFIKLLLHYSHHYHILMEWYFFSNNTFFFFFSFLVYFHLKSGQKDGKRLPNNHRQMLDKNGTLVVSDITKESDEGYYSCTASNDEGVSSSNGFHLTIQGESIPVNFSLSHYQPLTLSRFIKGQFRESQKHQ